MAKIRVEGVTKRFGRFEAVNQVSFTVEDGEFAALLGPSGCGKTTLLRCIAGLEKVDSGQVYLDSELANDLPPRDRDLSMVFQGFSLFPLMSVRENIAFPLKVRGASPQAMDDKVREVANLLGIEDFLSKRPKELSGGEQQRVAIGRAIARSPKAFLMDEPLTSLDAPLRAQLRSELKRIQREIKVTTLYVTHDQGEALALADRVGVMNRGTLVQYDTATNVFEHPSNILVARFVGDPQTNTIEIRLSSGAPPIYMEGDGFRYPIGARLPSSSMKTDSKITLAIRPEDIELSKSPLDPSVQGEVRLDETLTLFRLVTVRTGNVDFRVLVSKDVEVDVGQRVWLRMNLKKVHFFNNGGNLLA